MEHTFKISDGRGRYRTYPHRFYLRLNGFRYDKGSGSWLNTISSEAAKTYIRFAEKHHLHYEFVSVHTKRSSSYKKAWKEANRPWHGLYLCAYCGRIVREKNITVDHIVPVNIAKTSLEFERSGRNINDLSNLCGACSKCNRKKSDKGGLWVLRGRVYRHKIMRILRLIVNLAIMAGLGYAFYLYAQTDAGRQILSAVRGYIEQLAGRYLR